MCIIHEKGIWLNNGLFHCFLLSIYVILSFSFFAGLVGSRHSNLKLVVSFLSLPSSFILPNNNGQLGRLVNLTFEGGCVLSLCLYDDKRQSCSDNMEPIISFSVEPFHTKWAYGSTHVALFIFSSS